MSAKLPIAAALMLCGMVSLLSVRGDDAVVPEVGLAVGETMPFHVVDFVNYKNHCGCPAGMVSNTGGRGLIIWSRAAGSDAALQLARSLDGAIAEGDKLKQFLVVFDMEDNTLAPKSQGIANVIIGAARHSAKQELDGRGVAADRSIVLYFLEKKVIWEIQSFTTEEMNESKIKEIAAAAKTFAAGKN